MSRFASALTWLRGDGRFIQAALPAGAAADGKLADLTGPGITDRWGVTKYYETVLVTCQRWLASSKAADSTAVLNWMSRRRPKRSATWLA